MRAKRFVPPAVRGLALLAVVAMVMAACGGSGDDNSGGSGGSSKTYVIGTSADFPPMEFRDPNKPGEFQGFEIDMVKAMMGHLGWKYRWRDMKFDGLLPAVQAGQVDMVVSDVYDTEERQAVVDFMDYVQSGLAVMVAADNASGISGYGDLCGKSLGVLTGSPAEADIANKADQDCKDGGKAGIDVQSYPSVADELPQIDNGRLFSILEDVFSLSYVQKQNAGKYEVVFQDPGLTRSGIVVKKGSSLKAQLQSAFDWYKSSGQYGKDLEKWGLPSSAQI
jgi:polar amino acid transport system substrate-binding protein